MGPSKLASKRASCERDVNRLLRFVGPAATGLLLAILVENIDPTNWCNQEAERTGDKRKDSKKETGRFIEIMNRVAEFYGVDSARDKLKSARSEMERC